MIGTNKYTTPKLSKGKKPTHIQARSTIDKEWAKNVWYVNYSYNGKQYRITEGINRIKDSVKKGYQAKVLLESVTNDLANGYNPENPQAFLEVLTKETITLAETVDKYLTDLARYSRKKTVQSYQSKLRYLVAANPNKQLNELSTKDIEKFIHKAIYDKQVAQMFINGKMIDTKMVTKWAPATVKVALAIYNTFFNWCISEGYTTINQATAVNKNKIKSENTAKEKHIPFSIEDNKAIMNYLDIHDKFAAFFCRFIYSTCIRPKEIIKLKIRDIDLTNKQIIIPRSTTKNTKKTDVERIDIEPDFWNRIENLNLNQYPNHYHIISNDFQNIVGEHSVGVNTPYNRFVLALKKLNLTGKGYTLYGFKHFSNIQRFNNGWTVAEIMKANRHSSISTTEKYLKNITRDTDISKKLVPVI